MLRNPDRTTIDLALAVVPETPPALLYGLLEVFSTVGGGEPASFRRLFKCMTWITPAGYRPCSQGMVPR